MRRIALNSFAMPFGVAGLGGTWLTAAHARLAPRAVGDGLLLVAAAVWLAVLLAYGAHVLARPAGQRLDVLRSDLRHPVLSPFAALVTITPMVLVARGLTPYAPDLATVLTDVLIGLTVLYGGWFTGRMILVEHRVDDLHPGYFLPTVAGGLLAGAAAAQVGQHGLGWALFGYGVLSWLVLESVVLGRLFFGPRLPPPLVPTLAIEIAPPAVASLAWFALGDGRIDTVARALAGYGVVTVVVQLRLLPAYLRLQFSIGFWAFTFSWTAVATTTLHWIVEAQPPGAGVWGVLVLTAATVLVGAVAVRTMVALARGALFPPDTAAVPAIEVRRPHLA